MRTRTDFTHLETTIEALQHTLDTADSEAPEFLGKEDNERALEYLRYLDEFLADRRDYHKKQNVKKRIAMETLKKMLSPDELKEIDRAASRAIGDLTPEDEG